MPSRSYREIILLVESDPTLAQVLSRALVSEGLTIVRAADAAEALRLAALFRPRLALLDCNRREEEGAQLAAQLQKHQAGMRVIALSGCGNGEASASDSFLRPSLCTLSPTAHA